MAVAVELSASELILIYSRAPPKTRLQTNSGVANDGICLIWQVRMPATARGQRSLDTGLRGTGELYLVENAPLAQAML